MAACFTRTATVDFFRFVEDVVLHSILAELFHSSIAAISITTSMILAGMLVQIPAEYRIWGQIWDYLPTCFLAMWNTFDLRLISLFGMQFTSYQIVPLIYIVAAALLAFLGSRIYCRRQISGR